MTDRTGEPCPYPASRKVIGGSGLVWGPYCVGHAEDFAKRSRGEVITPRFFQPAECEAEWILPAAVP